MGNESKKYDFGGWATVTDRRCSDGRTIRKGAFNDNDGQTVPLVWNHQHDDPLNVLGHATLDVRDKGVYCYCTFNETEAGLNARELVKHRDVTALSIYANQLKQRGGDVLHGMIREVSLVLSGANPGAFIDNVLAHGDSHDDDQEEAIIYSGEDLDLTHAASNKEEEEPEKNPDEQKEESEVDETKKKQQEEKTVADVFEEFTEEQKQVVYFLIGKALEDAGVEDDEENEEDIEEDEGMKHNIFDHDDEGYDVLSHSEMQAIISDGKRFGSLKEAVIQHGVENIDYLFPDAKAVSDTPGFIRRGGNAGWVDKVMTGVHHTPFSRIKSVLADLTEDEARAKGYIKGKQKKDEIFSLLKRTTTPQTVYKKQKLDRDDVIDITDFDVVAWLKGEMRFMLDEEIARAVLVGDGRLASSDDKISEEHVRPIWTDDELYAVNEPLQIAANATGDEEAKAFVRGVISAQRKYQGSGSPTLFASEDIITKALLLEDTTGRMIYDNLEKLATTLRVKEIVAIPAMSDGLTRKVNAKDRTLLGIVVNLNDYTIGADKGGAVNMFDDFDIDYNAMKYLIETRISGALTKPHSALVIEKEATTTAGA